MKGAKKKLIWSIVFILLVIVTIWTMTKQSGSFTIEGFIAFAKKIKWYWMLLALLAMFGFAFFEGMAIRTLAKMFGYERSVGRNVVYASADVYFSAITPAASGGQPASALFMIGDGIPATVTTIVLLINLTLYALSIIAVALICLIFGFTQLQQFDHFSVTLIIFGIVLQVVLVIVFLLLVYKEKIIMKIADFAIRILSRFHMVKRGHAWRLRIVRAEAQYKQCAQAILQNKRYVFKAFIYNFLQRASMMMVSVFVFAGYYGRLPELGKVFITQGYVVIGSNTVPIPGAVGVADYLFMDGFGDMVKEATNFELLSRGIAFYGGVLVCGAITLVAYVAKGLKEMRQKKNEE